MKDGRHSIGLKSPLRIEAGKGIEYHLIIFMIHIVESDERRVGGICLYSSIL